MSRIKSIKHLLEACEKNEFDKVVRLYLKEEYNYNKVVFTDGKDDVGMDVKIFDFEGKKLQFQLTTQKSKSTAEKNSFEKKLKEDFEKARINNEEYAYANKLIYFYSHEVTNKRIREYEKLAFKSYNLDLEFIDATRIAEEAEEIISIQTLLYDLNKLDVSNKKSKAFEDDKENLIFDLLSFGRPAEFKLQIIEAFVLQSFYINGDLSKQEIIDLCESKFEGEENTVFYDKLVNQLQAGKRITKTEDKLSYTLTDFERTKLRRKNEQHSVDERVFINDIKIILTAYSLERKLDDYIIELKSLYVENFNSDLEDLIKDSDNTRLFAIQKHFIQYIEKDLKDSEKAKELAKSLLKYCLENKFIQKIAASKVYCNNINYNRLQIYLNSKKRIFIDTSIGLYALCYYYKPESTYSNYFYKVCKNLMEFIKKENMQLFIAERYTWEIQNHIKEAYNILPFTTNPNFHVLGNSRNVFYNFYNHLKTAGEIDSKATFGFFLSQFGFTEFTTQRSYSSKIEAHFKALGIACHKFEKEYEIDEANRLFELDLDKNNKFKTKFSKNNDSIMLEFLADKDLNVHPLQPVFVTWDTTFFNVQQEYSERFPNAQDWLMLSPNKLIDAYAILKFSINSETVTENLLALISDDLIQYTHSLVDAITYILNPKNEVSLEYASKLASIRRDEIQRIANRDITIPDNLETDAVIDDIVFNLINHYQQSESRFEQFKAVFTKADLVDEVIKLLLKSVDHFYKYKKIEETLYEQFDLLIEKAKLIP